MRIDAYDSIVIKDVKGTQEIYDVIKALEDCFYYDRYNDADEEKANEMRMEYSKKLNDNAHVITAFYEGKPVGCWGVYMNNVVEGYMYATYCAVRPDLGLLGGIALLKMFSFGVEIAREQGMMEYILKVQTRRDNKKAQRMCENLGFRFKGETTPDGKKIYMESRFTELADAVEVYSSKFMKRTKKLDEFKDLDSLK